MVQYVFNAADTGGGRNHLWVTDGTAAGTRQVSGINTDYASYYKAGVFYVPTTYASLGNGKAVFYAADAATGTELWVTDGTAAGTSQVKDILPGSDGAGNPYSSFPANFTALNDGRVLFSANDGVTGTELWVTDGTAAGTVEVADILPGSSGSGLSSLRYIGSGRALFAANNGSNGTELWISDGTAAGTRPVRDINPGSDAYGYPNNSNPSGFTLLPDGRVLFSANDGTTGQELWVTDGTAAGTQFVKDINAGSTSYSGTPYPNQSFPSGITSLGDGRAVFSATDGSTGTELWVSDGTAAGTSLVRDIYPGSASYGPTGSFPASFASLGNGRALFTANDGSTGTELWVTDGTAAGTFQVRDIFPGVGQYGANSSYPTSITSLQDGRALFTANDGSTGNELWVSDGTAAGTSLVRDIYPGSSTYVLNSFINSSYPTNFASLGDGRVAFSAYDGSTGIELWVSDGTAAGTFELKDLNPGFASSSPNNLTALAFGPAATEGNDVLPVGVGSRIVDGGGGYDALDAGFLGYRSAGTFTRTAAYDLREDFGNQVTTLRNMEEIRYADGRLALWQDDPVAKVTRLYQAALGRLPDQNGLATWIAQLRAGTSLDTVASLFLGSAEYQQRYGNPDNAGLVDLLYRNVLGREADPTGRANWLAALDAGQSRAGVLVAFSESPENRARAAAQFPAGIWERSETAAQVARLYDTAFGRAPDLGGLLLYKGALEGGTLGLGQVADLFAASPEFLAGHGQLTTQDFVASLYRTALHRDPDAAGLQVNSAAIDSGNASRGGMMLAFSESAEHKALTAPRIGGDTPDTFGIQFAT